MDKATMGTSDVGALRTTYTYHGIHGGIYRLKATEIVHNHLRDGGTLPLTIQADAAMVGEPDMLTIVSDTTIAAATLGRKGGAAKTPAKKAASAANGAKGSRPVNHYQIEFEQGGGWLRAHLDFDGIADEYLGRKAADVAIKQLRKDNPEHTFRVAVR